MKHLSGLLVAAAFMSEARAQDVGRNILYTVPAQARQVLDVYSRPNSKNLPVVFWIHGGGWEGGDKSSVQIKPKVFNEKGFVFVSTNYRLLPRVDMETIVRDVAKSIHWVHDHIAEHGGDPNRLFIMGHSAGAQLAALICTDDRYLKVEGLSLAITKGCVPVDGDTYDVPAVIEAEETLRRAHGLPQAKFGHREKFGNDPAKHRDFSAVTHVAKDKGIPPFLILHVASHPYTSAQAQRLGHVLKEAGVPTTVFGARESTHNKINANLGRPDDLATKALFEFLGKALNKSDVTSREGLTLMGTLAEWMYPKASFGGAEMSDGGNRTVQSCKCQAKLTTDDSFEKVANFYEQKFVSGPQELGAPVKGTEAQSVSIQDDSSKRPLQLRVVVVNRAKTSTTLVISRTQGETTTHIAWTHFVRFNAD